MADFPTSVFDLDPSNASETLDQMHEGYGHVEAHNAFIEEIAAVQTKVGTGSGSPDAIHKRLKATGANVTGWGYNGFELLGSVTASGSSGVMEVSSINGNFRDLLIKVKGRSSTAGTSGIGGRLTVEGSPTSGAYNEQNLLVNNTTVSASQNAGSSDFIAIGIFPTDGANANVFGASEIRIFDYASAHYKNTYSLNAGVTDIGSAGFHMRNSAGLIELTAAITTVRILAASGNWMAGSRMDVYGLPAA